MRDIMKAQIKYFVGTSGAAIDNISRRGSQLNLCLKDWVLQQDEKIIATPTKRRKVSNLEITRRRSQAPQSAFHF